MRRACKSNNDIAGAAGQDPDRQELLRQLKAGERVLRVQQERSKLHFSLSQLGEELKGVRVELSDSVKENRWLCRGIYSKSLSELL